jgi:hypothetical protein
MLPIHNHGQGARLIRPGHQRDAVRTKAAVGNDLSDLNQRIVPLHALTLAGLDPIS